MQSIKHLLPLALLAFLLTVAQTTVTAQQHLSDAPNDSVSTRKINREQPSYDSVLKTWKNMQDINEWIKDNFSYSMDRARELAENSTAREKTAIYAPADLYQKGKGVCIDLSRFAVETMRTIDPGCKINYLLIEFEPITINGAIIRKHWMAVTQDTTGYLFFADSKRPGYVAGPFPAPESFIAQYEAYRQRKIVSWKVLPGYQKRKKATTAGTHQKETQ